MASCAKLLMVFLSNLGWQISVWNTSCHCSSSWWWWWLLLWDLLERCKEVPFVFSAIYLAVAPGFGGRIFVGERYYTLHQAAPSLCGRQRPSGVLIISRQKYTVWFPHRVTGRFKLYTVNNFSFLQSTSGAVRNRSSLREDV